MTNIDTDEYDYTIDDEYDSIEHRTHFPYRTEIAGNLTNNADEWCCTHMPDPNPKGTFHGWRYDYYMIDDRCTRVIFAFRTAEDLALFTLTWA